ncbi:S8 family serine peptidase [Aquimarina algicola]|uniref:Peptidase S8 n=1 Tax=Aquimarina algicola TaxID=2589995 RepID=A0A504JBF5_9FLAO|nr:S8 family serine peptidase [Aquimarina algicola]TPN87974.1 peptidase S8 [Aquimarina algicola]
MKNSFILLLVIIIFTSCKKTEERQFVEIDSIIPKAIALSEEQQKNWQYKDIINDTIPGISLNKAYNKIIKNRRGEEIIVAVLDTDPDINHEDLINNIWINKDEIPNNNIDDDGNGYIDDINGWNFVSNAKGNSLTYVQMEETRILSKYNNYFEALDVISKKDKEKYELFKKADSSYRSIIKETKNSISKYHKYKTIRQRAFKIVSEFLSDTIITIEKLDKIKTSDSIIIKNTKILNHAIKKNFDDDYFNKLIREKDSILEFCMNINYDTRIRINDDQDDITDKKYGSPYLSQNINKLKHSTAMSGMIAADRTNKIGLKGVTNNVKIMPLYFTAIGDYTDKDLSLAIKYAVDNGAKIINLSQGKSFSLNQNWVERAIKYAESKNVLIVKAAGNDNLNIDKSDWFPKDQIGKNGKEFVQNVITVGASTFFLNSKLKNNSSNYGKNNVDLFAPGYKVKALKPKNQYGIASGSSYSTAIVSGVAALIRSHHPDLSAFEVKDILMKSGVSYDIDVEIKQEDGSKKLVPFSELSKSGKIVNAYNALLMAEQISKSK